MGIQERKEREKERRRQQIMVAAKRVFSNKGFNKATMEDIAQEAELSPGTLYPVLHRLTNEGYLESYSRVVNGRVRKYYQATAEGKQALEQSKKKIRELVSEVIEGK